MHVNGAHSTTPVQLGLPQSFQLELLDASCAELLELDSDETELESPEEQPVQVSGHGPEMIWCTLGS